MGRESERGPHEAGCAIVSLCAEFDVERRATADKTADVMDALLSTTMSAQERKNEALRRAAGYGLATLVERLIAGGGADVDGARPDDGVTPLLLACERGDVATVELLLAAGSDVDKVETTHGATPLHVAAQENQLDVVKLLIAARADVNEARDDGVTPLYIAAQKDQLDVVKLLITARADVNKARDDGVTPVCGFTEKSA